MLPHARTARAARAQPPLLAALLPVWWRPLALLAVCSLALVLGCFRTSLRGIPLRCHSVALEGRRREPLQQLLRVIAWITVDQEQHQNRQ